MDILWGEYGYFLESHNDTIILILHLLSSKISHRNNLRPSKDVIRQLRLGVLDSPADVTTLLGPSFPWDSAVNQSGANFAKFENSQKIEDKSYDDNFFTVSYNQEHKEFWGG